MKTKQINGSEALVKCLLEEGVDTVFGYPGGQIMPVYDALYDYQDRLNHILTRHEQGSIHAAQGYARATGRVGVCIATSGPGATNLITGIADAMIDSVPLICITGQVAASLLGSDAFQECDIVGLSMPITKWNYQITDVNEITEVMAKAFYIANSGRPGPVLIDITKDVQNALLHFEYKPCTKIRSYIPTFSVKEDQINAAAALINQAKKPLVLLGQGVILSGAEKEFIAFIEKTGMPSAWTLLGLSAIPTSHPLNVGMLGMHGNYGPNIKTNECDVLIAVGMRFDDRVTGDVSRYAKQAKVIHLEIDPAEINKIIHADVPLLGDAKLTLKKLTAAVKENKHTEWIEEFRKCDEIEQMKVIKPLLYPAEGKEISMGEVVRRLTEQTHGDAILVTDVGQHQMISSRYFKFNQTRSNITSGGLGTMGFGLPAAIGAKIGCPSREVLAVVGDGGIQMTLQELGTILQEQVKVKLIILNNQFLGNVRQWQEMFFNHRYSFTDMISPDFVKLASAYNIAGQKVSKRTELDKAIKEMLEHDGAYVLEVMVEKEGNVFPMIAPGNSVSDIIFEPKKN